MILHHWLVKYNMKKVEWLCIFLDSDVLQTACKQGQILQIVHATKNNAVYCITAIIAVRFGDAL